MAYTRFDMIAQMSKENCERRLEELLSVAEIEGDIAPHVAEISELNARLDDFTRLADVEVPRPQGAGAGASAASFVERKVSQDAPKTQQERKEQSDDAFSRFEERKVDHEAKRKQDLENAPMESVLHKIRESGFSQAEVVVQCGLFMTDLAADNVNIDLWHRIFDSAVVCGISKKDAIRQCNKFIEAYKNGYINKVHFPRIEKILQGFHDNATKHLFPKEAAEQVCQYFLQEQINGKRVYGKRVFREIYETVEDIGRLLNETTLKKWESLDFGKINNVLKKLGENTGQCGFSAEVVGQLFLRIVLNEIDPGQLPVFGEINNNLIIIPTELTRVEIAARKRAQEQLAKSWDTIAWVRLSAVLTTIRDYAQRRNLSNEATDQSCLDFMEFLTTTGISDWNNWKNEFYGPGFQEPKVRVEQKEIKEQKDSKENTEISEEVRRIKNEITESYEMSSLFSCPMLADIPENPVRIPGHPVDRYKLQFFDRDSLPHLAVSPLWDSPRPPVCPLSRATLPYVGDYRNVSSQPADQSFYLFFVAAEAWLAKVPAPLLNGHKDGHDLQKKIQEFLRTCRADAAKRILVANAEKQLATLKAGGTVAGLDMVQKGVVDAQGRKKTESVPLLGVLIRSTAQDKKLLEEENVRDLDRKRQMEIQAKRIMDERIAAEKAAKDKIEADRIAAERLVWDEMQEFNGFYGSFLCPIDTGFPVTPVRIVVHPVVAQRRQLYERDNAVELDECPVTNVDLSALRLADGTFVSLRDPRTLVSAETLLIVFAHAATEWINSIPATHRIEKLVSDNPVEENKRKLERDNIRTVAEAESEIKELFEKTSADRKAAAAKIFEDLKNGRAVPVGVFNQADRDLLGFLIPSAIARKRKMDAEQKAQADQLAAARMAAAAAPIAGGGAGAAAARPAAPFIPVAAAAGVGAGAGARPAAVIPPAAAGVGAGAAAAAPARVEVPVPRPAPVVQAAPPKPAARPRGRG